MGWLRTLIIVYTVLFSSYAIGGEQMIKLPKPKLEGKVSVEEAISKRRSVREFKGKALTLDEISQLLWAAQGMTDPRGYRAAPSAGALYPLEVYLVTREVEGLEPGVYKYHVQSHSLTQIQKAKEGMNPIYELYQAALSQECIRRAHINMVFGAVFERTTTKYRERGYRYVYMEAGHAAQNVLLQAEALGLGGVVVGAFYDEMVRSALSMAAEPVYIISIGRK